MERDGLRIGGMLGRLESGRQCVGDGRKDEQRLGEMEGEVDD